MVPDNVTKSTVVKTNLTKVFSVMYLFFGSELCSALGEIYSFMPFDLIAVYKT